MPYWQPPPPTEGLATASFATSLACLLLAFACGFTIIGCPVGAVLGHVALRRIGESGAQGRGLALAGVIIGWIGTALMLGGLALVAIVLAVG